MALTIRLRQQGKKNQYVYRLVLTDTRFPRDGKYIEMLGWYNPFAAEAKDEAAVDAERILHWLNHGVLISERAKALLKRTAPNVLQDYQKKVVEKLSKACEKKKTWRKKQKALAS